MKSKRIYVLFIALLFALLACRLPEVIFNGGSDPVHTNEPPISPEFPLETESPPAMPTEDPLEEIIIAPDGTGDYPSLEVAIAEVPSGAIIKLQPGKYYLSVVLNITKELTLIGSGPDETFVIGTQSNNTLRIDTSETITLADITFSFEGSGRGTVIHSTNATLYINNCTITNGQRSDDAGGSGLYIDSQSSTYVRDSRFENNDLHGIELDDNANLTLLDSSLLNNGEDGIVFFSYSMGTVSGNEISGNGLHGIGIKDNAIVTINNNSISSSTEVGIRVSDNGNATISENNISNNGLSGIIVRDASLAVIENNNISYNNETGVVFFDDATGSVINNELNHNVLHGASANGQTSPQIEGNDCSNNTEAGIRVSDTAMPTITDNTCNNNGLSGVIVTDSAQPVISGNTFVYNGDAGIAFLKESFGEASNNTCTNNRYGIYISSTADPIITDNNCSGNTDADIEDNR